MSVGLLALLDDVVSLTKIAAASLDDAAGQVARAGAKAAGVVIDDAAVTPRYVVGFAAERELPIVGKIAAGSLKNKLLYLLPAALVLSFAAPWAVTPPLMLGGAYLSATRGPKRRWRLSGRIAPTRMRRRSARRSGTLEVLRRRRSSARSRPTSFSRPKSWPSRSGPSPRPPFGRRPWFSPSWASGSPPWSMAAWP